MRSCQCISHGEQTAEEGATEWSSPREASVFEVSRSLAPIASCHIIDAGPQCQCYRSPGAMCFMVDTIDYMDSRGVQTKHAFTGSLSCLRLSEFSQVVHVSPIIPLFVALVLVSVIRAEPFTDMGEISKAYCPFTLLCCVCVCAGT